MYTILLAMQVTSKFYRTLAAAIDIIVAYAVSSALWNEFYARYALKGDVYNVLIINSINKSIFDASVFIVVFVTLQSVWDSCVGASVGKILFNMRTVGIDGELLSFRRASMRNILKIVPYSPFSFLFGNHAYYDKIASSQTINGLNIYWQAWRIIKNVTAISTLCLVLFLLVKYIDVIQAVWAGFIIVCGVVGFLAWLISAFLNRK